MAHDHFYTVAHNGELAPAAGYEREGTACFVFPSPTAGTAPLYRWFSPISGDHFYTLDPNGEIAPQNGYVSEGTACHVFSAAQAGTVPLYRWFSGQSGDHFYTLDPNGEIAPQNGYVSEGVACHVFSAQQPGTVPFFRWYNSGFMLNYTFDAQITAAQRLQVLERHSFGHFQAKTCGNLTAAERTLLLAAYARPIAHGIEARPDVNASATVGGNQLSINFNVLFPLGDQEIAQTLIHEMMHCAGYTHPVRCDAGDGCNPVDVPHDGGAYYNSPPLRAELCIAGDQSDAAHVALLRGMNILNLVAPSELTASITSGRSPRCPVKP